MRIEKRNINEIKPYWRNPRKNDKAVAAVKESIRKYGYTQPIVVDRNNVIIAGHTRYKALLELGFTSVAVVVADLDDEKAKQYRIADNKTAELSEWDEELLAFELREITNIEDMTIFFDGADLDKLLALDGVELVDEIEQEAKHIATAQVIAQAKPQDAGGAPSPNDPEIQRLIEERTRAEIERRLEEERQRWIEEENRRIAEQQAELQQEFRKASDDRQEDYIEVKCPYCEHEYALSKSELLRSDKIRRAI